MNAARRAARAGRNLLIALLLGAVIIIAIVVAYVAGRTTPATPVQTSPLAQATTPSATSSTADVAPTGCLSGTARDASMLLATQKQAASSTFGAVEVAASFFRWSYRTPVPSASEVQNAKAIFVPSSAAKDADSLIADYARNSNGSAFYLTTVGGSWVVDPGAVSGDQRVSIVAPLVIDGAVSATKTSAEAFDMRWVSGAWRVVSLTKVDPAKVVAGGTGFTAGC